MEKTRGLACATRRFCFSCVLVLLAVFISAAPGLSAVEVETVPVGHPGNVADAGGYGSVGHSFQIGKYEVTAAQYTAFLNAVASTEDTYGLYSDQMGSNSKGCHIQRSEAGGQYTYSVAGDWANRPVNFVSWADAARFANWLHNGQPIGSQDENTTETGSYDLTPTQQYYANGDMPAYGHADYYPFRASLVSASRSDDATWVIPSADEWHKAAYYRNTGSTEEYFTYPTTSNDQPSNGLNDGGNSATYKDYFNDFPDTPDFTVGSPYWMTEVGAHSDSTSPSGTFDQGGNVTEWTSTPRGQYEFFIRGGCFENSGPDTLKSSFAGYLSPMSETQQVGFRLVYLPEPSLVLMMGVGLPLLVGRRSRARRSIR